MQEFPKGTVDAALLTYLESVDRSLDDMREALSEGGGGYTLVRDLCEIACANLRCAEWYADKMVRDNIRFSE